MPDLEQAIKCSISDTPRVFDFGYPKGGAAKPKESYEQFTVQKLPAPPILISL
jgi:hypothetical protein